MLMNRIETAVINSPVRRGLQRFYEVPLLARLGGRVAGGLALEVGCGSGEGTRLILDKFGAARVDALDLDPAMVKKARRRLARYGSSRVRLAVGSATGLREAVGAEDASYDAVFEFGIIHHVEDWRAAVAEIARVLRPGGRFFFEEVTATALARPSYQRLFAHPAEDRFTAGEFLAECGRRGLAVGERWATRVGGDYLFGVAERTAAST
jgi:ubiquinone/menaquinone biosynthesis C-methylase UbiE